jgi:hypothetical protein
VNVCMQVAQECECVHAGGTEMCARAGGTGM